ncbi:MAG: hypothetical protein DWQ44_03255 [Bacteroidetes bacterium]|nr:MAG: hypothetical protein DWQ33_04550 [Bacteroidota bacterium]REJ99980.1 MAG: hypothetical protein DWQ39_13820 [Bacteroidota bacterium]REK35840.1 MAG: hypothetical protein DWQ44_03255 [Bacteroidota bacterium]REK49289.1 MAG: hypothetical protein DWQ48_07600 [Bacteroidota bacterium]
MKTHITFYSIALFLALFAVTSFSAAQYSDTDYFVQGLRSKEIKPQTIIHLSEDPVFYDANGKKLNENTDHFGVNIDKSDPYFKNLERYKRLNPSKYIKQNPVNDNNPSLPKERQVKRKLRQS